jgi:hypothetical protein
MRALRCLITFRGDGVEIIRAVSLFPREDCKASLVHRPTCLWRKSRVYPSVHVPEQKGFHHACKGFLFLQQNINTWIIRREYDRCRFLRILTTVLTIHDQNYVVSFRARPSFERCPCFHFKTIALVRIFWWFCIYRLELWVHFQIT